MISVYKMVIVLFGIEIILFFFLVIWPKIIDWILCQYNLEEVIKTVLKKNNGITKEGIIESVRQELIRTGLHGNNSKLPYRVKREIEGILISLQFQGYVSVECLDKTKVMPSPYGFNNHRVKIYKYCQEEKQ